MLESSRTGTGREAPGQPRLPNREMQPITVGDCWYADARGLGDTIFFLQAVVGVRPGTTSQVTACRKVVMVTMGWQEKEEVVRLNSDQHKQVDAGRR